MRKAPETKRVALNVGWLVYGV